MGIGTAVTRLFGRTEDNSIKALKKTFERYSGKSPKSWISELLARAIILANELDEEKLSKAKIEKTLNDIISLNREVRENWGTDRAVGTLIINNAIILKAEITKTPESELRTKIVKDILAKVVGLMSRTTGQ